MIIQQNTMPFEMLVAIPMFVTWIVLSIIAVFVIWKEKKSIKVKIALYLVSLVIAGFVLGGIPNAVMPIQQVLIIIGSGNIQLPAILPLIIIIVILLLSTIVFGRLFCGYACPVGTLQELLSRLKFKSNPKEQKNVKYCVNVNSKMTRLIRWAFLVIIVILSLVWSIALLQVLNPFLGLSVFRNPLTITLLIPIISLISVAVLSIFLYRPWCRFLCPFGAISGETSKLSVYKIRRTEDCTECGLCEKACPSQEAFSTSKKGECYLCGRCIEICPQNALKLNRK